MLHRLRQIIDCFAAREVRVGFETGQETADTLLGALEDLDRPSAGVNFDPANMILYGMGDPVAAVRKLATWIVQVHIKDARVTEIPGTWGTEEPAGAGEVEWGAFFRALEECEVGGDLMIEREAGASRIDDIRRARELVESFR